jgi:hypothetical protein
VETKEIKKVLPECKKAWNAEKHKVSNGLQDAIYTLFKCTEALCDKVDTLEIKLDKIEKKMIKIALTAANHLRVMSIKN